MLPWLRCTPYTLNSDFRGRLIISGNYQRLVLNLWNIGGLNLLLMMWEMLVLVSLDIFRLFWASLLMMNFFMLVLSLMLWFDMLCLNMGLKTDLMVLMMFMTDLFILDWHILSLGLNMLSFFSYSLLLFYFLVMLVIDMGDFCLNLISFFNFSWILLLGFISGRLFNLFSLLYCFNFMILQVLECLGL